MKTVGVLALQGAIAEHLQMLEQLQVKGVPVKHVDDLANIDGLIIPGGESTAISRLIQQHGLYEKIQQFAKQYPVMGTCAGLILCGKNIVNSDGKVMPLGLIDITVERNGFGRQVDSFEAVLSVKGIVETIPAVFIRAPFIQAVGEGVKVLATVEDKIVMAEQGNILVMAFHPELTKDTQIVEYFIRKIG
ncbi:pyridoxal 5'-phosphate synthase glutaminase subunit PdxT [Entomomonas asaccharolytica]|uniref:Pyridoxal 5'-phosphate synthase subunit PdxT n=1 Tax=Entomomonas asaccharolytica TaxID=2785331 RepID=A0A974RYF5_9GAMM|nr:pyridoxal 5'-phosphate synthase glutaminase subunit PdxT [Entomomonas asaccharolytica]QQP85834.1 pyridoxal 5'-phosphate synthase glutaminase subunit PdxT [Entomomonas asaccharolytica]